MTENLPHAFCVSTAPERWLITTVPAGFERFAAAVTSLEAFEPGVVRAVAAEHGVQILGPSSMLDG